MQVASNEHLRIQSCLYPWVLFSVLNEQLDPCVQSIQPLRSFPSNGVFSICEEAEKWVVWDVNKRTVSILHDPLPMQSSVLQGKVGFCFGSSATAVDFYEKGTLKPGSFRHVIRIPDWVCLIRWLLSTQKDLGVAKWQLLPPERLLRKVMLTLMAAVAGLNGLALLDPFSRELLHHLPDGVILLHIEGVGRMLGRIQVKDGALRWLSSGERAVGHEVDFSFKSLEVAWKSVANLADNLAAVGMGEIHLRGYIPLADGFNHMLDRLQMYVKAS